LSQFLPETEIVELPEIDLIKIQADVTGLERKSQRLKIFTKLLRGENLIVLATPAAVAKKDFSRKNFLNHNLKIEIQQNLNRDDLIKNLIDFDYERADEVSPGKFSVRGGIIDIFPINWSNPFRIEFFDETVESIRKLNAETLRSIKNFQYLVVLPVKDFENKNAEPVTTCASAVIFDEPARIKENLQLMLKKISAAELEKIFAINAVNVASFQGQEDFFIAEIKNLLESCKKIFICATSDKKIAEIKILLKDFAEKIIFEIGSLSDGFIFTNLAVITEKNIFGSQIVRRKIKFTGGAKIKNFTEIKVGDYVVHATNGIGKYLGVETLEIEGIKRDYLQIQYGGGDKLYLPTDAVQFLQKYVGGEDATPKLSKLNTGDWARKKSRAKAAVEDIAEKLGTYGTMLELRRIKIGDFSVEQAVKVSEVSEDKLITLEELVDKEVTIKKDKVFKLVNGMELYVNKPNGIYKIYIDNYIDKKFIGIGILRDKYLKRQIIL